ncbi:MAG: amidohydrolase family protein [Chloroflexi bacterium]|nr:amidohydrolase family protein [Chloroflexota bacterium]
MLDLLIRGGRVVTPSGVGQWDIGVQGEKIVTLALPGTLGGDAKKTVDATDKIVVPGGIEAHAHIGFPHLAQGWGNVNAGPDEQTLAALWGGTTTVVDFATATLPEGGDVVQAVESHMAHFKGQTYADYSAHCTYRGYFGQEAILKIKDLIAAGFPSIKVFTVNPPLSQTDVPTAGGPPTEPSRPRTMVDMGRIGAIMEQQARYGGILAVHSEDDDIVQYNYATARQRGLWDWYNMHLIRSNLSEDLSVRRVIRRAEQTGAAMYVVHTSAKEGVNAIAEARSRGLPIYGETILLYCSFNCERYKEPDGMKYHTYPSLKYEEDRLRLWDGLLHGDLSIIATDSIATDYAGKIKGRTVADVQGGNIGIEIRMGVAYTEGVVKQGMSLERYAAITSTNPAKLLGFYPRKGVIAVGSDADITIIDPSIKKRLRMKDLHLKDYNSWEGWQIEGWPTVVVLRGKVMVEKGKFFGKLTDGKLIPRKIDPAVLQKPVC